MLNNAQSSSSATPPMKIGDRCFPPRVRCSSQEIRQAVIKRNVTMPSASKKRLEGTKGKERMLKISADKPPVDGGNGEGGSGSGLDIPEEDAA